MITDQMYDRIQTMRQLGFMLTGARETGDKLAEWWLRAELEASRPLSERVEVSLARFHATWLEKSGKLVPSYVVDKTHRALLRQNPLDRALISYTSCCGFSCDHVADFVELDCADVRERVRKSKDVMANSGDVALIIEDDPIVAEHVRNMLGKFGFAKHPVVKSAAEAVTEAKSRLPGLIVTDIELTDGRLGLMALKKIKSWWSAPAIVLTSFPEDITDDVRSVPVVSKPFQTAAFKKTVASVLAN